jgi:D-alanyl-D-alanine carboxypeptidase (penicillin-binding protein 5/6)
VRRNRIGAGLVALATVATAAGLAAGGGGHPTKAAADIVVSPRLRPLLARTVVVPGTPPALGWPAQGEGAVAVQGIGLVGASPHQRILPIASLTKMMTAYVVLHDHPLAPGQSGPSLVMAAHDVAAYVAETQADNSNVPVRLGERLSELQLLEALLLPSADNIADRLGVWDAGSDPAFVARMNATARALGLLHTHYADASGLDPRSRSTAADQARLASDLMALPVVRAIVVHPSLPFPVAGTVPNYNPALGTDGIVGVKSGFTPQAQGCLAVSAYRIVGGRHVLVVAVSLDQPDALYGAARAAERLLGGATAAPLAPPPSPTGTPVATAAASWAGTTATARAAPGAVPTVGWPGLRLVRTLAPVLLRPTTAPGAASIRTRSPQVVGRLVVHAPWGIDGGGPVVTSRPLPPVPAGYVPPVG